MTGERRPLVAVIGNGAIPAPPDAVLEAAEALGRALVDAGYRVITGGLGGVMEAASRGARSSPRWCDGDVIGVVPGYDAGAANPYVDVCIATGMGYARNVIVGSSADAVVAVLGGAGTLSEMALAWQLRKPVIALDLGAGWSHALAGRAIDDRRDDVVARTVDPLDAVAAVTAALAG